MVHVIIWYTGGNTKTLMVACISPAEDNYDETLSTLRYANRAKNIKNQPKVNEDPKDALIRQYQEEILKLKQMLEGGGGVMGEVTVMNGVSYEERIEAEKARLKKEYDDDIRMLNAKYDAEHQSTERLQHELEELQDRYEVDLNELTEKGPQGNAMILRHYEM